MTASRSRRRREEDQLLGCQKDFLVRPRRRLTEQSQVWVRRSKKKRQRVRNKRRGRRKKKREREREDGISLTLFKEGEKSSLLLLLLLLLLVMLAVGVKYEEDGEKRVRPLEEEKASTPALLF